MSYAERRHHKNARAQTWQQLHAWRCYVCMEKISQADYRAGRNVLQRPSGGGLRFRLAHVRCP